MKKKQEYLKMHPYAIWQSKDGKYWYTTFPDCTKERGVRQIRRNSKAELEDAIVEYWGSADERKTIEEVYEEWSNNRLETKKIIQATHVTNRSAFNVHFKDIKDKPINDMRPLDWCDFLEKELISHNMTRVMFSTLKSLVLGIIKRSFLRGYIDYSPSSVTDLLDIPATAFRNNKKPDEEEVYNEKETPIIIKYLIEHQDNILNLGLLLMFVTGIRVGEMGSLKHGDFVGCTVQIRRTLSAMINDNDKICRRVRDAPKTLAGIRDVIIPEDFRWLVEKLSEGNPDDYVFINSRGNLPRNDVVNRRLRRVCEAVGIPYRSSHKIRKTYGSILLDNGVNKRFTMEQMGHNDINCTENYYHKNRKDAEEKREIINRLGGAYKI